MGLDLEVGIGLLVGRDRAWGRFWGWCQPADGWAESQCSWLQSCGGPGAGVDLLVGGAGPGPSGGQGGVLGQLGGSKGPKTAGLVVGVAVFLCGQLLGLGAARTGANQLVHGARPQEGPDPLPIISYREDSKTVLTSMCPCGGMSSPKWLPPASILQGESLMLPTSPEGSPRSASGSDPGSFQITASVLGLRVCEILCVPCKNGISVSYSPLAILKTSPIGVQIQVFWGLYSQCKTPKLESLMWGLDPSIL